MGAMFSLVRQQVCDFIGVGHFMLLGLYGGELAGTVLYFWLLDRGYYPLFAAYTLWYIYDFKTPHRGGRPWSWTRNMLLWRCIRDYFPLQLVKTAELTTDKNYFMICHPHGFLGFGVLGNLSNHTTGFDELFPGIRNTISGFKMLFWIPFFREYLLGCNVVAAEKKSLEYIFTKRGTGNAVCLVPGGTREVLEAEPGSTTLVLNDRKGFVKIALKTGTSLVPVFTFGENETHKQLHHLPGYEWLKRVWLKMIALFGFPLMVPTTFYPKRHPLTTVVGAPITVEKNLQPSKLDIDELHERYKEALVNLFEEQKLKYGMQEDQHLNFI